MLVTILDTVIGVITGYISLVISHWILAPRITISSDVRAWWSEKSGRYTYYIRLKKTGLIDLIDVRVQARLHVRNVDGTGGTTWDTYRIDMSLSDRIRFSRTATRISFKLHDFWKVAPEKHPLLFSCTRMAIPEVGIRMEDFFMSHRELFFTVQFIGSDSFTGVTKAFVSPRYRLRDIRFGDWDGMTIREAAAKPC